MVFNSAYSQASGMKKQMKILVGEQIQASPLQNLHILTFCLLRKTLLSDLGTSAELEDGRAIHLPEECHFLPVPHWAAVDRWVPHTTISLQKKKKEILSAKLISIFFWKEGGGSHKESSF